MTHIGVIDKTKKIYAAFYQNENEKIPVRDWLMEMEREDRRVKGKDIQKVEFGWPIGMPYCRSLGKGLREVRSSISNNRIARVLFFTLNNEMILLHGFIKKTQKTPDKEKNIAIKRMKEVKDNDAK